MTAPIDDPKVDKAKWLRDTGERAALTFMEAFAGIYVAAGVADVSVETALKAGAAGLAAGASVVKSAIARFIGDGSASLDPKV